MKLSLVLGGAFGVSLALVLGEYSGLAEIARGLGHAGWGVTAVIAFHPLQIAFSSLAWRALLPEALGARFLTVICLRWIREAVNNLLPVAQIGGEFVAARLLHQRGVGLAWGAASVTVDLTVEMMSQIIFTILGLVLLVPSRPGPQILPWIIFAVALAGSIVLLLTAVRRCRLFQLIERCLVRLAARGWSSFGGIADLHRAIVALCAAPARLGRACAHHLISWMLGGFEVMLALHLVGVSVDLREGLIIESLGQALRAAGFAIPASLGAQEGGYVLVCGLLGISPQTAIELSLLKRMREVALGVPALIAWPLFETRRIVERIGVTPGMSAEAQGD